MGIIFICQMLIFKFLLFLQFLYFIISTNLLKCGMKAFQNNKKYFVIIKELCYEPDSNSSKAAIMNTNRIFTKLPNQIPVFRIVSGTKVDSYTYFINTEHISGSVIDERNNLSINFRSSLLDEWNNLKPTNINVTVKDSNDKVVAWIYFKVNDNDNITTWFSKDNLESSFPWEIETLLNYNYNFFSISGLKIDVQRSFYINTIFNLCPHDLGILCVFDENDTCSYASKQIYPKVMFAVNNLGQAGNWNNESIMGKSLEIIATYTSSIIIYA